MPNQKTVESINEEFVKAFNEDRGMSIQDFFQSQYQKLVEEAVGEDKKEINRTSEEKLLNACFGREKVFTTEACKGYNQAKAEIRQSLISRGLLK